MYSCALGTSISPITSPYKSTIRNHNDTISNINNIIPTYKTRQLNPKAIA